MSREIDTAIAERLADQAVADSITGGIFAECVPRADEQGLPVQMPYAVVTRLANVPRLWTTASEYREHRLQVAVYDRAKADVETHLETLQAALAFAPLALPQEAGEVLEIRRVNDLVRQEDQDVWQGVVEYRVLRRRPVTYQAG